MLIATVSQASANNVTWAWDKKTEHEVVGYNTYYRTDTPDFQLTEQACQKGLRQFSLMDQRTLL